MCGLRCNPIPRIGGVICDMIVCFFITYRFGKYFVGFLFCILVFYILCFLVRDVRGGVALRRGACPLVGVLGLGSRVWCCASWRGSSVERRVGPWGAHPRTGSGGAPCLLAPLSHTLKACIAARGSFTRGRWLSVRGSLGGMPCRLRNVGGFGRGGTAFFFGASPFHSFFLFTIFFKLKI